jgi:hypothetical protein
MRRDDVRFAAAARDDGLRKISKYTWRAGAAGVVCSALIAAAFGHHAAAAQPGTGSGQHPASGSGQPASGTAGGGTIVVPAQPPAAANGGGQVTSGAS